MRYEESAVQIFFLVLATVLVYVVLFAFSFYFTYKGNVWAGVASGFLLGFCVGARTALRATFKIKKGSVYGWLRDRWWARQRDLDLRTLWPTCKEISIQAGGGMEMAREAFSVYAFEHPAWVDYYGRENLKQVIDELE